MTSGNRASWSRQFLEWKPFSPVTPFGHFVTSLRSRLLFLATVTAAVFE
ncbi:MAG: hypothetical protein FWH27_00700 [Planctomycetaceae bacterium]|nr:hypothetical protein [Planctomycetaceae bacterium]